MRMLLAAWSVMALAGAAAAQPAPPETTTVQCIDAGGHLIPPLCRVPASRLDTSERICSCIHGGQHVQVPVCAKGESPPPEGHALEAWRSRAAKDGSLVGDVFQGKPVCAPRRQP